MRSDMILFWARLRKDVGTRAALEWWMGSAATEEQISNWEKAHRALMPAHLIVQRLQSGEYEAVGWEVENGGDSAVRRACWYMAGMLPYTADWGESWELYCQKWQDYAHDVLRLLTFPGDMLHLTAQAEIGQPRRVRDARLSALVACARENWGSIRARVQRILRKRR